MTIEGRVLKLLFWNRGVWNILQFHVVETRVHISEHKYVSYNYIMFYE